MNPPQLKQPNPLSITYSQPLSGLPRARPGIRELPLPGCSIQSLHPPQTDALARLHAVPFPDARAGQAAASLIVCAIYLCVHVCVVLGCIEQCLCVACGMPRRYIGKYT